MIRETEPRARKRRASPPVPAALLLLAATGMPGATEVTPAAQALAAVLFDGDAGEARAGFAEMLDRQIAVLEATRTASGESPEALSRHATRLRSTALTLELWEGAELKRRGHTGEPTPATVLERLMAGCDALEEHAADILGKRRPSTDPERILRNVEDAARDVGVLLLRTNAFVEGTSHGDLRQQLLDRARRFVEAPETVHDFETKHGTDAERAFELRPRPTRPPVPLQPAGPGAGESTRPAGDDPALRSLVRDYLERAIAADFGALEMLFADRSTVDRQTLRDAAVGLAGWRVDRIGEIYARELRGGDLEVSVENVLLVDADGRERRTRDTLVVRRMHDGTYRIVRLDRTGG